MTLLDAIKPVETAIISYTKAELVANKPAVIDELKKLEVPAITHIADFVVGNLPSHGLLNVVAGPLGAAVKSYEKQIIDALGGEDEALFALVMHEVDLLESDLGLL